MKRTKNTRLSIRLNERELEVLKQLAEEEETTLSEVARASIFRNLKRREK